MSGKAATLNDGDGTITALHTFNRGSGSAPFAVNSGAAAVANLDADKLDGVEGSGYARLASANGGHLIFTDATYDIGASGATRPRDIYTSRHVTIGGQLDVAGLSTLRNHLIFVDATYDIGASGATRPRDLYLSDQIFERGRTTAVGEWISVSHSDANFTGAGVDADWVVAVGDQTNFKYTLVGKMMTVTVAIATSTVGNTPADLRITIPGSFVSTNLVTVPCWLSDAGTAAIGTATVAASGTVITVAKLSGAFSNATDTTAVRVVITFEIN